MHVYQVFIQVNNRAPKLKQTSCYEIKIICQLLRVIENPAGSKIARLIVTPCCERANLFQSSLKASMRRDSHAYLKDPARRNT